MAPEVEEPDPLLPALRYGRIGILTIHQITDDELARLAEGAPQSLFLNFAIAFLSISISFFASLATATFASDRIFTIFVVVAVVCLAAGYGAIGLVVENAPFNRSLGRRNP